MKHQHQCSFPECVSDGLAGKILIVGQPLRRLCADHARQLNEVFSPLSRAPNSALAVTPNRMSAAMFQQVMGIPTAPSESVSVEDDGAAETVERPESTLDNAQPIPVDPLQTPSGHTGMPRGQSSPYRRKGLTAAAESDFQTPRQKIAKHQR